MTRPPSCEVTQILSAMLYGQDGYFFVYDYDGTNLVSPRQTDLINRNWTGLTDSRRHPDRRRADPPRPLGRRAITPISGPSPSTGEEARMVTYVIGLQDWRWAVGTGVFIDDVARHRSPPRAPRSRPACSAPSSISGRSPWPRCSLVFISGLFINIRERRLADAKLKKLTQRVFDAQEEERGRVARELHDGISQILVGVRYALDTARRRAGAGDDARQGQRWTRASTTCPAPSRRSAGSAAICAPACWTIWALAPRSRR